MFPPIIILILLPAGLSNAKKPGSKQRGFFSSQIASDARKQTVLWCYTISCRSIPGCSGYQAGSSLGARELIKSLKEFIDMA